MCACPDACTSGSGGGGVAPGIIGIVMMILYVTDLYIINHSDFMIGLLLAL